MFVELRRKKWLPLALVCVALLATLASRIAIAHYLATDEDDDGKVYAQIAVNLLEHHVFSLETEEPYPPTLIRLPGYPLFLATVYSVFGHGNNTAVRMTQAVFDTGTCVMIALIAWNWVKDEKRRPLAAWSAFALAALCPFFAIHVATILTETLTTFFMIAMTLAATYAFKAQTRRATIIWWVVTGLLSGACVLLRPDSGLFAAAIGLTLVVSGLFARGDKVSTAGGTDTRIKFSSRLARTILYGAIFSFAFILVLVPWTIRNARLFHLFQPLAPAHAEMPGEFVPRGYLMWLRTWMYDHRYMETVVWNLDDKAITVDQAPDYAFDSADERARVAALYDSYNHPPPEEPDNSTGSQPPETKPANNQPAINLPAEAAKPGNQAPAPNNPAAANNQANANANAPGNNDNKGNTNKASDTRNGNNNANENDDNADDNDNSNDNADDKDNDNADDSDQSQDEAQQQEQQPVAMTPEIDAGFAQIARERIARAPFRYYVWMPTKRAVAIWFDTHSTYYPFSGELFPLDDLDHDTNQQFWLPLFAALMWLHTLLAIAGAVFLWLTRDGSSRRWLLLAVLMTLPRLIFFSTLENPEPRYVIELFAYTSILGGIAIARINWKRLLRRKSKSQAETT